MKRVDWTGLSASEQAALLERPVAVGADDRRSRVAEIIAQVRADGDDALRRYSAAFDGVDLDQIGLPETDLHKASASLEPELSQAIDRAIQTLIRYHEIGLPRAASVKTAEGVTCERIHRPIGRVGLYVPAGSAPLPSTVLMLGVPATLAGCTEVVLCCPPGPDGRINETVLAAAQRVGIRQVFAVGGAQAIAAMAFGTESIPRCDKLFGPGNAWVTEAKLQVSVDPNGAAIDMPAGPSEVLVVADGDADPEFVAADLLSQAEHGPDSQAILVSDSQALIDDVARSVESQLSALGRAHIAREALGHARLIRVPDLDTAFELSNAYAPEHLIIQTGRPRRWLRQVKAAGSVFLGPWSPESMGDYCSGTNHVLPTSGWARAYSGLSVTSFMTALSVQELTPEGLLGLGPTAEILARAEGLGAHENAVSLRLQRIRESRA